MNINKISCDGFYNFIDANTSVSFTDQLDTSLHFRRKTPFCRCRFTPAEDCKNTACCH